MKVYEVILNCEDNEYQNEILGIFSTEEKAQKLKSNTENDWKELGLSYDDTDIKIQEWQVD